MNKNCHWSLKASRESSEPMGQGLSVDSAPRRLLQLHRYPYKTPELLCRHFATL